MKKIIIIFFRTYLHLVKFNFNKDVGLAVFYLFILVYRMLSSRTFTVVQQYSMLPLSRSSQYVAPVPHAVACRA